MLEADDIQPGCLSGEQSSLAPARRILPSRCYDVPVDRASQRPDVHEVFIQASTERLEGISIFCLYI